MAAEVSPLDAAHCLRTNKMFIRLYFLLLILPGFLAQTDVPALVDIENAQSLVFTGVPADCKSGSGSLRETPLLQALRCCPATGTACEDQMGGRCYPWWYAISNLRCHYLIENVCGESWCYCCVQCIHQEPSQCVDNDGQCQMKCLRNEYEANYLECTSCLCKCCKKCEETQECTRGEDSGYCVGHEDYCGDGYYVTEEGCIGDTCRCCRRCREEEECSDANGYCERSGIPCQEGYHPSTGCRPGTDCVCCKPDCDGGQQSLCSIQGGTCEFECGNGQVEDPLHRCNNAECICCKSCQESERCRNEPNPGFCVTDISQCDTASYISTTHQCDGNGCFCCEKCVPSRECEDENGICQRGSIPCPAGYTRSSNIQCLGEDCGCCVPDVCANDQTSECARSGGICQPDCEDWQVEDTQSPCNDRNCTCCKSCLETDECKHGTNPGFCVTNVNDCIRDPKNYISTNHRCEGNGCSCCESCVQSAWCTAEGGICQRGTPTPTSSPMSNDTCFGEECHCYRPLITDPICVSAVNQPGSAACQSSTAFCTHESCPQGMATVMNRCNNDGSGGDDECFCCMSVSFLCSCEGVEGFCSPRCPAGTRVGRGCTSEDVTCQCCIRDNVLPEGPSSLSANSRKKK